MCVMMPTRLLCGFSGLVFLLSGPARAELETRAEASDYLATSSHAEAVAFCQELARESDRVILTSMGISGENRDLPLLILSHDGITEPNDRLTVLCMGNIHAGEVCGKEALLMLARDLARAEKPGLLEHVNLLIAPIYNADGNEKMALDNRPGQIGPEHGRGERENSTGLDLNRDYVKADAPETQALLKLLRDWDPDIVIDTHTTNGSHHRYTLTYDGPRHPNTDPRLVDYVREKFLPKVGKKLVERSGYESFFYGNFEDDHQRWETYPALPRYGAHYLGLGQRIGILSEAYSYAPYKDRVLATRGFVHECLTYAHEQREKIAKLLKKSEKSAGRGEVVLRHRLAPFEEKRVVKGVVEKDGKASDEAKDYLTDYWGDSQPTLAVALPYAYVIPAGHDAVVAHLQRHGVKVRELRENLNLTVTRQRAVSQEIAEQAFQGHRLVTVHAVGLKSEERRISAGSKVVYTDQRLGKLAAFLLEPQSEDGLTTWGILQAADDGLYPVLRLEKKQALLTCEARPLAEDREMNQQVTFETLHGDKKVSFDGSATSVTWLDDSESFLQRRDGHLYQVNAATGKAKRFLSKRKLTKSLRALPALTEEEIKSYAARQSWTMDKQRTGGLLTYHEDLYHVPFDGSPACRLTSTPGEEELATFSPDGAYVAFVREANLYVIDLETQTEQALTQDGSDTISNGKAAWVYFEELYGRSWKAFWWSPDSRHLAFHRFDSSRLPMFHALDSLPLHGELKSMRHPKAGDPNPDVQLGIAHVAGGHPAWVDLSNYMAGTYIVSHVSWRPGGKELYYYVQDRAQTWLDFITCSSSGRDPEKWFRDTTKAWVESPGESHFVKGGVVFASERTGWRHLYRYTKESSEWQAITEGKWEVRDVHAVDEDAGTATFSGTKDSHIAENLYRVTLDGKKLERLTKSEGSHRAKLSPDGKLFVDAWSDFETPTQVRLFDPEGALVRTLDTNPVYALEEYDLAESAFHQIATEDGFLMETILTKPLCFDESKPYPAWFRTYSGPHAPVVKNTWNRSRMTEQMLAGMGLIVFRMDPRSASGKGAESAWTAYKQLGTQEMKDIEEGIAWLTKHPFVDPKRIGMHGHSYGGYMTAYCLTHSKLFAAGISGAPVTDWRYYDSIYTERYMDTPQDNPDGYASTSVVKAAKNLHGKLLLLHGIMDDNVHLQNSTQFIKALQDANKDFQVMLYPTMKHGLHGDHYDRLLVNFIRESLGLSK
ncbi:MAG: dipeptidyl-peptidase-4 [Verrucomicrobiales bacterium]